MGIKISDKYLQKLRDKYRATVCAGCSCNRYNFQSGGERPGIDAPTTGEGCFHLGQIRCGKCPQRRQ